ncbi:MAG: protein kinase [Alphaproteobacteria bacterium]
MSGGPRLRQDDHLSALQPGARLQTYTIGSILGAGGFGITYKAVEDITRRDVAIKEYLPTAFAVRDRDGSTVRPLSEGAARDFEWGLERFREEAKLLIVFRHPNIVPVLAYFESNGTGYLVMEFQDGASLGDALRRTPVLSQADVLHFAIPLLDGVEEVHRRNVLHRDIKPENIFIRADGSPVLLDFGAARQALGEHTRAFTTLVTEGYAPFEQYAGTGNQGPWSDIYALAAVMLRCLTGKAPVEAPRRAIAKLRGKCDPMAQDFSDLRGRASPDLAFAIEAAMRVVEQERPQSIAAFREMIVSPGPSTIRLPASSAPGAPPAATLIPDAAMRELARRPPPWMASKPRRARRLVHVAAAGLALAVAASGAAYVGDQRRWLPEAFRRAWPEMAAPAPAKAEPPAMQRTAQAPPPVRDVKPGTETMKRPAEDEARRAGELATEEQRAHGMAEYQRLQLDQIEAERRQIEARRAQPPPRKPDESAPEARPAEAIREGERPRSDTPDDLRDAGPGAPPSPRVPPADMDRVSPYPPELSGRMPRGSRDPRYEDED